MAQCNLTKVTKAGPRISLTFADKTTLEFTDLQALKEWCHFDRDEVKRFAIGMLLGRSPDLSTLTTMLNKTLTVDLTKANPVTVV